MRMRKEGTVTGPRRRRASGTRRASRPRGVNGKELTKRRKRKPRTCANGEGTESQERGRPNPALRLRASSPGSGSAPSFRGIRAARGRRAGRGSPGPTSSLSARPAFFSATPGCRRRPMLPPSGVLRGADASFVLRVAMAFKLPSPRLGEGCAKFSAVRFPCSSTPASPKGLQGVKPLDTGCGNPPPSPLHTHAPGEGVARPPPQAIPFVNDSISGF
nr:nascent polypeptide-associated complex subunit alpha, muscle-specific form-like [Equus caballus]